jgi:hypothetical protein
MNDMTLFEAMEELGERTADMVAGSIVHDCGPGLPMEAIRELQRDMVSVATMQGLPMRPTQVEHLFADGMYARKYAMPAGQLAVTKTHKQKHFIVVVGDWFPLLHHAPRHKAGYHGAR